MTRPVSDGVGCRSRCADQDCVIRHLNVGQTEFHPLPVQVPGSGFFTLIWKAGEWPKTAEKGKLFTRLSVVLLSYWSRSQTRCTRMNKKEIMKDYMNIRVYSDSTHLEELNHNSHRSRCIIGCKQSRNITNDESRNKSLVCKYKV